MSTTIHMRESALAETRSAPAAPTFAATLHRRGLAPLTRGRVTTLQVNVGRLCNLACHHCHVEAGPKRPEIMAHRVAERIVRLLDLNPSLEVVDLTGGAPEMNPSFRFLVTETRRRGRQVIDRCNLTVFLEDRYQDLPEFLAAHEVQIVASLPCYQKENVDGQRGRGVFDGSIEMLKRLNTLGYGRPGSPLRLDLVYNPLGASLPDPLSPGNRILTGNATFLSVFGLALVVWGAYTVWLIVRNPDELTATENHPSWRHMYLMMMAAQVGFAVAYVI